MQRRIAPVLAAALVGSAHAGQGLISERSYADVSKSNRIASRAIALMQDHLNDQSALFTQKGLDEIMYRVSLPDNTVLDLERSRIDDTVTYTLIGRIPEGTIRLFRKQDRWHYEASWKEEDQCLRTSNLLPNHLVRSLTGLIEDYF